mgnify:CR=1 FL=1
MPNLRVRPNERDESGAVLEVTPESAGWTYVGFKVITLEAGESTAGGEEGREACLVILSGKCDVEVEGQRFENIGERMSVFDDISPAAVYAPAGAHYAITARTKLELAIGTAPGQSGGEARLIEASAISKKPVLHFQLLGRLDERFP